MQIVHTTQEALASLLVRLMALEATLHKDPLLTGGYSADAHHWVASVRQELTQLD